MVLGGLRHKFATGFGRQTAWQLSMRPAPSLGDSRRCVRDIRVVRTRRGVVSQSGLRAEVHIELKVRSMAHQRVRARQLLFCPRIVAQPATRP